LGPLAFEPVNPNGGDDAGKNLDGSARGIAQGARAG